MEKHFYISLNNQTWLGVRIRGMEATQKEEEEDGGGGAIESYE